MTTSRSTPSTAPSALHIAVGIVGNACGEVLVCQRPPHKIYPGEWEFPGGKVERAERVTDALRRELHEELGIDVRGCRPLIRVRHVYPELSVDLDTWLVTEYRGTPVSTEHPATAWVAPGNLPRWPLLAADRPIVNALRLPVHLVVTPPDADPDAVQAGVAALPPHSLLRLRLPAVPDAPYRELVRDLAASPGQRVLVDRTTVDVAASGAAGFHATAAMLARLRERPVPASHWFGASCHTAAEIARAREIGADYLVVGPVRETSTHPGQTPLGWAGFAAMAAGANLPVYAIGGLGPRDLEQAWTHGAQGVAGISAYWR